MDHEPPQELGKLAEELGQGTSLEELDAEQAQVVTERARQEAARKHAADVAREQAESVRGQAALDALAAKAEEVRAHVRRKEEWKLGELKGRWEGHRNWAQGLDLYLAHMDRAFKGFYERTPDNEREQLEQYDKLMGQLRIACSFYKRDVEAFTELPSSTVVDTMDIEFQEIRRIQDAICAINEHASMWGSQEFIDRGERESFLIRERVLCERFSCKPEEIARNEFEISSDTKVYTGRVDKDIFEKLRHVEHVLIPPSNEEIPRMTVSVGEYRNADEFSAAFLNKGEHLNRDSFRVEDLETRNGDVSEIEVVRLSGYQMGQQRSDDLERLRFFVEEAAGLRPCNLKEALTVQLRLLDAGEPAGRGLVMCRDEIIRVDGSLTVLVSEKANHSEERSRDFEDSGDYGPEEQWWLVIPKKEKKKKKKKKKKRFGIF